MPISFSFQRSPQGKVGCTVGVCPGMYVGAFGDSLMDALHAAAHVGGTLLDVANANPELLALLPPGTGLALKAISAASAAAKSGATPAQIAAKHGPKVASIVQQIRASGSDS